MELYGGKSESVAGESVACAGRGDGGGEYAGGSRKPCGSGDGAVEI